MPTRRQSSVRRLARAVAPRRNRADETRIIERRGELVVELARLRETGASHLTDNAQQLLTRWWSSAGWASREQLLRTVQWLIDLENSRLGHSRRGEAPSSA